MGKARPGGEQAAGPIGDQRERKTITWIGASHSNTRLGHVSGGVKAGPVQSAATVKR